MTDLVARVEYRICYSDTDAMGVVHHSRYLEIAERSRSFTVHEMEIAPKVRNAMSRLAFVVRGLSATYHSFGYLDDVLIARTSIVEMDAAMSWWLTEIEKEHESICSVLAEIAYYDINARRAGFLPQDLAEAFENSGLVRPSPKALAGFRRRLARAAGRIG